MLREGRLVLGPHVLFEPGVWLTSDTGRIPSAAARILNLNVMVAAVDAVEIGEHCMFANGCLVTDAATASTTRTSRAVAGLHPKGRRRSVTTSGSARTSW